MGEIKVTRAVGKKCTRCWRVLAEVGDWKPLPDLCLRCVDAVLMHDTGEGLHEHAARAFDTAYCQSIAAGMAPGEAEIVAAQALAQRCNVAAAGSSDNECGG